MSGSCDNVAFYSVTTHNTVPGMFCSCYSGIDNAMTTRILLLISIVALLTACSAKQELPDISFDGLERLSTKQVNTAYIDPNADFGVYRRIAILEPAVSFRANWQRDQNRSRSQRISDADM